MYDICDEKYGACGHSVLKTFFTQFIVGMNLGG